MSTILQALKRLEKEQPAQGIAQPTTSLQGFDTRLVLHHSARKAWWRGRLGGLSVALVFVMVAGGGVLLLQRHDHSTAPEVVASRMDGQASTQEAEDLRESGSIPESIQSALLPANPADRAGKPGFTSDSGQPTTAKSTAAQSIPRPQINSQITPRQSVLSEGDRLAPPYDPDRLSAGPGSATEARVAPPVAASSNPGEIQRESRDAYAHAGRLHDERLTVQAIAWSTNADDRMAVINNRVVREGNVVDGFTIVAIEEQIIYVREGGRLWQVRFGQQ